MKKWFQKSLVILVALLTFGLVTPNHSIWNSFDNEPDVSPKTNTDYNNDTDQHVIGQQPIEEPVEWLLNAAKEQSYIKFGSRIAPVISDDFEQLIFPKIEEAIKHTVTSLDKESIPYLVISDQPSGNYSEKIFHIYDGLKGNDLIRFHVRTEKRPQEGYFYNFHYHTYQDQFAQHYDLGDIYWSKNTPPKWLS